MKVCVRCKHIFTFDEWICPSCGHQPERLSGIEAHAPEFANVGGGFKPEYFAELSQLEADNFWFRARNELILWAINKYKSNATSFLEVGCGTGFVLSGIASANPRLKLYGSEIFIAGLPHAIKRVPSAHFMQMDGRSIPFVKEFDSIGLFDVLEHIQEDEIVLNQLYKSLKNEGVLFITVPQHPWLWSYTDEIACHVRRYKKNEIEEKVKGAGFEILRSTSFVSILLPMMILSRMFQKNKKGHSGELNLNKYLNKLLFRLMMLDVYGVKLGLNYPIGGSRIIIAKKVTT